MRRILAVDDNEDILEVLKFILEYYNYEVTTLTDGNLLADHIKNNKPDLILLDIMLGNTDGRELCVMLKSDAETHDIPIIMISASHGLSENFKASNAPNDFLTKPFDITDLLNKIQTHLSAA